jgi:hypothetical protein
MRGRQFERLPLQKGNYYANENMSENVFFEISLGIAQG